VDQADSCSPALSASAKHQQAGGDQGVSHLADSLGQLSDGKKAMRPSVESWQQHRMSDVFYVPLSQFGAASWQGISKT